MPCVSPAVGLGVPKAGRMYAVSPLYLGLARAVYMPALAYAAVAYRYTLSAQAFGDGLALFVRKLIFILL
jgi:hypothetical protein